MFHLLALYLFAEEVPCSSTSFHNFKILIMGKSILFTGVCLCWSFFIFFGGCLTHLDIRRALDYIFPFLPVLGLSVALLFTVWIAGDLGIKLRRELLVPEADAGLVYAKVKSVAYVSSWWLSVDSVWLSCPSLSRTSPRGSCAQTHGHL